MISIPVAAAVDAVMIILWHGSCCSSSSHSDYPPSDGFWQFLLEAEPPPNYDCIGAFGTLPMAGSSRRAQQSSSDSHDQATFCA